MTSEIIPETQRRNLIVLLAMSTQAATKETAKTLYQLSFIITLRKSKQPNRHALRYQITGLAKSQLVAISRDTYPATMYLTDKGREYVHTYLHT